MAFVGRDVVQCGERAKMFIENWDKRGEVKIIESENAQPGNRPKL